MRHLLRAGFGTAFVLVLAASTGCSDGPKIVKVSGTLTRNGKPVPHLTVNFIPANGRPSWGLSDDDGRFTLEYDDTIKGALVGPHTVWVVWRPSSPAEEMASQGLTKGKVTRPDDYKAIAEKYGNEKTTPLKIEIVKSVDDLEIKLD